MDDKHHHHRHLSHLHDVDQSIRVIEVQADNKYVPGPALLTPEPGNRNAKPKDGVRYNLRNR